MRLKLPRQQLASLDQMAKALAKALPAGTAPSASELAARYRMKVARDEGAEREKVDLKDAAAISAAAAAASALYAWPRKEK